MKRVKPLPPPADFLVPDTKALGAAIRAARCAAGMTLSEAALCRVVNANLCGARCRT